MKEKIRKRALPVFLSVLLLIGLMPLTVSAESYNGFTYEDNGDGVTITDYTGSGTDITIPTEIDGKPVTAIGNQAFFNCNQLRSMETPSELQKDDSDTKQAGSPQTGENSSLVFWLALMGVSVFGCIETAVYRRKNKQ